MKAASRRPTAVAQTFRSASSHLGIRLREYDAQIPTLIPHYHEMLDAAAAAAAAVGGSARTIVDLGTGSGALAARCAAVLRRARVVGIDTDEGMLALARRRLGRRLRVIAGDFAAVGLPRCDIITASFALHHVRTRRAKSAVYGRCVRALRRGGALVNADCCLSSSGRLQAADRRAWLDHLQQKYTPSRARGFLRAWAHEDVYFRLDEEVAMMRAAGFVVDVPWRMDSFAVIVGTKP